MAIAALGSQAQDRIFHVGLHCLKLVEVLVLASFHHQAEVQKLNEYKHMVLWHPSCERWPSARVACRKGVKVFDPTHANKNTVPALKTE